MKRIPQDFYLNKTMDTNILDRCNAFFQKITKDEPGNMEVISPDQENVIEMDLHLGIFDVLEPKSGIKVFASEDEVDQSTSEDDSVSEESEYDESQESEIEEEMENVKVLIQEIQE